MIFKPKQGIKQRKCRILCKFENLYFAKQALRRLWRYVTRLFRFSNTFWIYNSMLCWFLYRVGPKCPVLRDERWVLSFGWLPYLLRYQGSFPFPGGDRTSERKSTPGVSKKLGRSGEGVSEKGEGVGRKGIASINQSLFIHEIVSFFHGLPRNRV